MSITRGRIAALAGVAALLVPAVAGAKPGPRPDKPVKGKSKPANYIFKGTWNGDGTVAVTGGNARVRKGGLVDQTVAFDVTAAKLRVADTNADGAVTAEDLLAGDKVVIQARLPRTEPGTGPFAARKVVDQTHPVVEEEETVEPEAPVVPAPEVPAP